MKHVDTHLVAALAIVLSVGVANAQSSGSGGSSSGSGGSSGGAAELVPALELQVVVPLLGPAGGSPALGSTPSGPITPNRSNSEVFPPSRLAPRPGGSIPDPGTSTSTTTPSNQGDTNKDGRGTVGSNPQDPAAAGKRSSAKPRHRRSGRPNQDRQILSIGDGFGLHEDLGPRDTYEQSRLGPDLPARTGQVG